MFVVRDAYNEYIVPELNPRNVQAAFGSFKLVIWKRNAVIAIILDDHQETLKPDMNSRINFLVRIEF